MSVHPFLSTARGLTQFAAARGRPILYVYGEDAFRTFRGISGLYRFSKVGLPVDYGTDGDSEFAAEFAKMRGHAVVLWPAAGALGLHIAKRHGEMLVEAHASAVGIVTPPEEWGDVFLPGGELKPSITPSDVTVLINTTLDDATALALPIHVGAQKLTHAIAPAHQPVDGPALYTRITTFLASVLSEPQTTIDTIALWCLHTWALDAFDLSPRLVFQARDPRADHARALRVAAWLTPAPLVVSRTIAVHLLPAIAADRPTLLLDDVGGAMFGYIDMRALIAAGASRDGAFLGQRTKANPSGVSPCFAPTAIATASRVPQNVAMRAIVVPLSLPERRDAREALTLSDPPEEVRRLRADMQRWAKVLSSPAVAGEEAERSDAGGGKSAHSPLPPSALGFASCTSPATAGEERRVPTLVRSGVWSPLLAIAAAIGGEAVAAADAAMKALGGTTRGLSSELELLDDIRELVGEITADATVASLDLLEKLVADPERAWATANHGRKLTARGLAERLARFGVRPHLMRMRGDKILRGYDGGELSAAFARYLDDVGVTAGNVNVTAA